MQSARLTQRADPFIQQDPNNPRYSRRLSKEQWEHLKPQVSELFYQRVSTADILRHVQAQFNVHITRSQLDTQMRKWEFIQKNEPPQDVADPNPDESTSSEQILQPNLEETSLTSSYTSSTPASNGDEPCATADGPAANVAYPRLCLPEYEPTDMVRMLRMSKLSSAVRNPGDHRSAVSERRLKIVPEIAHTALILTDLKCFGEAFNLWYLITSTINDAIQSDQLWGPQLVFVAATCARSAWTDEQVRIANVLVEQLCGWRDRYFDHARDLPPGASLVGELPSLLTLAESLLEDFSASAPPKYWSTTHYSANILPDGLRGSRDFSLPVRSSTKALWSKDLRDWPQDVANLLFASYEVQRTFLEAMTEVEHCLREGSTMAGLVENHWHFDNHYPPDARPSPGFAQNIACLALEHADGLFSRFFGPGELLDLIKVQAMAALPFVLVTLIPKGNNVYNRPDTLQCCLDRLYHAAQEVKQALYVHEANTEYKEFIDVYLEHLNSRPKTDPSLIIINNGRLAGAAAAVACMRMPVTLEGERPTWSVEASGVGAGRFDRGAERFTGLLQVQFQQQERIWTLSPLLNPPMARSYTSSVSSGFRSFKGLSRRTESNVSLSRASGLTTSTVAWSERMSWRFSGATGLSSNPSVRESSMTDVFMDGVEEEGREDYMV